MVIVVDHVSSRCKTLKMSSGEHKIHCIYISQLIIHPVYVFTDIMHGSMGQAPISRWVVCDGLNA